MVSERQDSCLSGILVSSETIKLQVASKRTRSRRLRARRNRADASARKRMIAESILEAVDMVRHMSLGIESSENVKAVVVIVGVHT